MFGFKTWQRNRIKRRPFPGHWLALIESRVPYYQKLPEADRRELLGHIRVFLAEKHFEGCGGLAITDAIQLTIAAQACRLLLHRKTDYYPGLTTILVYPQSYLVQTTRRRRGGIVTEETEENSGESWREGTVILSWEDIAWEADHPDDGCNVILHEFAHQIDDSGARGDSTPALRSAASQRAWARILRREFKRLRRDVRRGRPTFLDEYGATSRAEFFAVATEYFFELPRDFQTHHPALYRKLKLFYQQDPTKLDAGVNQAK